MYSKVAGISETNVRNRRYASSRPYAPQLSRFRQLKGLSVENARWSSCCFAPAVASKFLLLPSQRGMSPSESLMYCPSSRLMPGPAGLGRAYPGLVVEYAARASKKSSRAAAPARAGAMAAMRTYQGKYRSRRFVATPRNGFSQQRKSYTTRRAFHGAWERRGFRPGTAPAEGP
jgi:hypothetical protein